MILGIDVGNYGVKTSEGVLFSSKITQVKPPLGKFDVLQIGKSTYYINSGGLELELNKADKNNYMPLFITAILKSSTQAQNDVVTGLPINQIKNKEELIHKIKTFDYSQIFLNGEQREISLRNVEVYPECIGANYIDMAENGIYIDVGGRTTNICCIRNGKYINSSTLAVGTINMYDDIANYLNTKYTLNIGIEYANDILERKYLNLNGQAVDLTFAVNIIKENFDIIDKELNLNFDVKTEKLHLLGGGSRLFEAAFAKRYDIELMHDYLFVNAKAFKRVGEMKWQ